MAAFLLAILFAPSLWMLLRLPPLWKDIDAYLQVTGRPSTITILHYGPAYCFGARVPLYLGYVCERLRAGAGFPSLDFFAQPIITDGGVRTLIWFQHLALCGAAYFLLVSITRAFLVRFLLAAFWAGNSLFYSFAHCVGSETLSLILLLLLATIGIRIISSARRVPAGFWILFGLLGSLSMLTRHINGLQAALLPLAFGFAAIARSIGALRQREPRRRRWLLGRARKDLRLAFLALALSLLSIALVQATLHLTSRAAGFRYQSSLGFTFLFRLNFLGSLTPAEREPILTRAAGHSRLPEVRGVLQALRGAPTSQKKFDAMALFHRWRLSLPPEVIGSADKSGEILNETARAFLIAPSRHYLRAVEADCIEAARISTPRIVAQLAQSTDSYFLAPDQMPQCANLETFRDPANRVLLAKIPRRPYFALWRHFCYARLFLLWMAALVPVVFLSGARAAERVGYAVALTVVGTGTVVANCFLTEFQPRFTLPAWVFTVISLFILAAAAAQSLQKRHRRRRAAEKISDRRRQTS